jgi:hypothetical protein
MPEKATTPVEMIARAELAPSLLKIFTKQPALTRLEPQSVSGDPRPGAEAVVADPLWAIGRQWQLGELLGEDAGSPVSVTVGRRFLPITAWAPLGEADGDDATAADWQPWPEGAVLDELVEHVPQAGVEEGLRWRAETGAQLAEMLREASHEDAADALLAAHPLTLPEDESDAEGTLDPAAQMLFVALAGAVADGGAAREALAAAGEPAWLANSADPAGAGQVASAWLAWAEGTAGAGGAWTTARLEHRFLLRFGHGADAVVLRATEFGQGSARWHHFEWLEGEQVKLEGDTDREPPSSATDTMLATPLRYSGIPADRYWQLEEGSIDVAAIEAQPHDLARLCLAEFALAGGDDWLVVPVDGRRGAINQIEAVTVTTTFGEQIEIAEARGDRHGAGFRMFEVSAGGGGDPLKGVVLPPIAATPLLGEPVEEVAFLRDETANLGWAVERVVPGRSGDPRQRAAEPPPEQPGPPEGLDPKELLYELQVPTPHHWIPLVPIHTAPATIALRKGALIGENGEPVLPLGLLLKPTPLTFPAEEIPREGITVSAVPALARRADGTYARWMGHRIRIGRGEGNSGLASDETRFPASSGHPRGEEGHGNP